VENKSSEVNKIEKYQRVTFSSCTEMCIFSIIFLTKTVIRFGGMQMKILNVACSQQRERKKLSSGTKLLLMAMPFLILLTAFCYVPLFGWLYAFFDYRVGYSLFECKFAGLNNFLRILKNGKEIIRVLRNTLVMSGLTLLAMPVPAIFAIMLNEMGGKRLKRAVQTVTTLPNFISWIIVYSLVFAMFSADGMITNLLSSLGIHAGNINPLGNGKIVWIFQLLLNIWKTTGWNAIIYIAAIAGIDNELYDAASVDGANRFQKILHITVPGLYSTFFVLLLLQISNLLNNGFDQYFVFFNAMVANKIEVLDYYVYKVGILSSDYSMSTALGMLKTFISVGLLFFANKLSKKIRGVSIV
jgi:ABC-type polysaccharide transport system permease subunit